MKTILVTGGTDGIGKSIVLSHLKKNDTVIAVGSSKENGELLIKEAKEIKKENFLIFYPADLSLVQGNIRLANFIKENFNTLDKAVFCAASLKPQPAYAETKENFEFTFALYYLSRYVLSYALKETLEQAPDPVILNVCAPGMKGPLFLDDLQMKNNYHGQKAQFHGSRLNDLLCVWFCEQDTVKKIKYILFNPMAARTPGAKKMAEGNPFMKLTMSVYYKLFGKDVSELVSIIAQDEANTGHVGLSAYNLTKPVDLGMETYKKENAEKLEEQTRKLLKNRINF